VRAGNRLIAYFDTNVFDNIVKGTGGVLESDVTRLQSAIESKALSLVTSILNISETIDARRPEIVLPQLKLIARLTDWDRFVKPHDVLLTDDITHFTWNGEPDRPFVREPKLGQLRSAFQRILSGHDVIRDFDEVVEEDVRQKAQFLRRILDLRSETYRQIQELGRRKEIPSFERYLEEQSERVARSLARRVNLEERCERLGIANLLDLPSVRITVGLSLSFIYRAAVEGKSPNRGASRDLQYAPPGAAAADVFVTHDRELAYILSRVPMKGFMVMTLREVLDEIEWRHAAG
jgi:hypothetical protein